MSVKDKVMLKRILNIYVFIGFAFSGTAALIYEVVWTRELAIMIGVSTYAVTTMLVSFMAGLSVGGWIGASNKRWKGRPYLVFALLELGIGVMGIMVFPVIKALEPLYIATFYAFHLTYNTFSFVQFIISFLIMGIPTTLMGMTFPVAVKLISHEKAHVGEKVGYLYGFNSFGAILGAVLSGFVLIPLFGMRRADLTAAFLNIGTAAVIFLLMALEHKFSRSGHSPLAS